jgi:hypothetical protein
MKCVISGGGSLAGALDDFYEAAGLPVLVRLIRHNCSAVQAQHHDCQDTVLHACLTACLLTPARALHKLARSAARRPMARGLAA